MWKKKTILKTNNLNSKYIFYFLWRVISKPHDAVIVATTMGKKCV